MTTPRPSVIFLNRFYWPDLAATSQMLTDLAEDLAENGWEVTVIASRTGYTGRATASPLNEVRNGVRVVRTPTTQFGRESSPARVMDYLTYVAGAAWYLLRIARADVVVALTDPPMLVLLGVAAARLRGSRIVCWAQDVYPELAARLGVLAPNRLWYRAAAWLARRSMARCDLVVALGPRMAKTLVGAGALAEHTVVIHNWADCHAIYPVRPRDNRFVHDHHLENKFVVLYSGNAGRAHTFDAVLGAAKRLSAHDDIVFLFIGGGKRSAQLRAAAANESLPNVRFLDYLPRDQLAFSLSAASVALVTEAPEVTGLLVPSKTYGILASGTPLLFVGSSDSDVAAIVRECQCGAVLAPDDADGLAATILRLRSAPEERQLWAGRARLRAEYKYDRRRAVQAWDEALRHVAASDP